MSLTGQLRSFASFLRRKFPCLPNVLRTRSGVSDHESYSPHTSAPAATGNTGACFEAKVGAFYLLALLTSGEPRGLPGARIQRVQFQQAAAGRPMDDIIVQALSAGGSLATLEVQAKRTLDFTASDSEFRDVVRRMWLAAQKQEFTSTTYELAVAISRSSTRIERAYQQVLYWARQLPDGTTFAAHIARQGFASQPMRDFVAAFARHLKAVGAPTDADTIWQLLRRFKILVFDFEAPGSDYEHRAREQGRFALAPDQADRAAGPLADPGRRGVEARRRRRRHRPTDARKRAQRNAWPTLWRARRFAQPARQPDGRGQARA